MVDLKSNENGQLMLLTGLLIVLQVIVYTTLLNNLIFTNNMPSSGLDLSKHDIREIRSLTEADVKKAANYANTSVSDPTNQTLVENYFLSYIYNYSNTINKMYSNRGASVEILLNNVTFNMTTSKLTANKYFIEKKQETFPNGSLIIPMDENQTNIIKVYGLVHKIVNDTNASGLSSIRIPVYEILQNPVNSTVPDFYSTIRTDDNASLTGDNITQYRKYSGGPFIVHNDSINETTRQMILTEAATKSITIHELKEYFTYNQTAKMVVPPRIAFFGDENVDIMEQYYADSDVPATQIFEAEIIGGNLSKFDILTIPHEKMTDFPGIINPIVGWVANGGVTHIECAGTDTMDDAIEDDPIAGPAKPWYGFIGVTRSNKLPNGTSIISPGIKLLDNSTLSYNNSPPMPLSGLSDPGAPYNPLTQSSITNGTFGSTGGTTKGFSLRDLDEINPGTNILGYALNYSSGSVLNGDYDDDGTPEPQLMYLEAPYDNGLVIYIAGHDLSEREPSAEGLIFESFFAASMRNQEVTVVSAKNINVTIKYSDGKVDYSDTFLVKI